MKNNKHHVYQVINKHITLLNCLLNSKYTSQYVPLFFINCCYYYTYCLAHYEEEELQ